MKFGKKEGGGPLGALQNLLSGPQIANEAKKPSNHDLFLNCVYASLKLAMTVSWSVCLLVHPSVMISFFGVCGFWAAAPKGSMTYAFTHMGNFRLLLDLDLWAEIWAWRLDLGLKARIWAARLGFGPDFIPEGGDGRRRWKRRRRKNFPICVKA